MIRRKQNESKIELYRYSLSSASLYFHHDHIKEGMALTLRFQGFREEEMQEMSGYALWHFIESLHCDFMSGSFHDSGLFCEVCLLFVAVSGHTDFLMFTVVSTSSEVL